MKTINQITLCAALTFASLSFPTPPARAAAVTEAWVQRYNNPQARSDDQAVKVVRDAAGDIIVIGHSDDGITGTDMLTVKYSGTAGPIVWQRRYDGPYHANDIPAGLAVDPRGNIIVTGSSEGREFSTTIYTAKYAATDGTLLWEKRNDGSLTFDRPAAVAVDGSGNVIVAGTSWNGRSRDFYTAKYATADGALLWERRYDQGFDDEATAVAVDGDGNVIVTGYAGVFRELLQQSQDDYYTAKYAAADGAILWEQHLGTEWEEDRATSIALDQQGNVIVSGTSDADYHTAKYAAADGALLWEQRYNPHGSVYSVAPHLAIDAGGNVVLAASSYAGADNRYEFYTAKYAATDGRLIWERSTVGSAYDRPVARALALDSAGNAIVTGYFLIGCDEETGTCTNDVYTVKYAAMDGATLWEKRSRGPGDSDAAASVAVDVAGNVIVAGHSLKGSPSYDRDLDFFTAKYAASNGATLWEQRHDGPGNTADFPQAVAVDSAGNVIVTGYSYYDSARYTAKYAMADGAILWEHRDTRLLTSAYQVLDQVLDDDGNVIVTGSYTDFGLNASTGYTVAKHAAKDGALLWERHSGRPPAYRVSPVLDPDGNVMIQYISGDGSASLAKFAGTDGALLWENLSIGASADIAVDGAGNVVLLGAPRLAKYAGTDGALLWESGSIIAGYLLAIDGSGNVIVAGSSAEDFYTAKHAAADGTLLWEQRYNGPANHHDALTAVATDRDGNVIVTGVSSDGGASDYATVKYAATDGALLWEKRYNGPGGDYPAAVAVDGDGNVFVTGESGLYAPFLPGNTFYYTAKYAAADGTLLWEQRYHGPANGADFAVGIAVGPNGMAVVTGYSDANVGPGFSSDIVTIAYRENQPPVITCPANRAADFSSASGAVVHFTPTATDDSGVPPTMVCAPPSGSVFPIGQTTVTCTATDGDGLSSACSFTVTVRGAYGVHQNALAELIILRATVRDQDDLRKLNDAVTHLSRSLAADLWLDQTHLQREHGERVFQEDKQAVKKLCELIKSKKSRISDAVLQKLVDRIFQTDRLLAGITIQDAAQAGLPPKKLEQAKKFLAACRT